MIEGPAYVALSIDVTVRVHATPHAPLHVCPDAHDVAVAHWPQASHVCIALVEEHCVAPGVHTGTDGHEQLP